ncbi:peptidyl-prolyl cis-trans isomerase [Candidatus Woesearchaeota archaeon]|nr:peptidyl-prolyl cis-trans isomerase [Candidatus Woesearchaeota archaeon]
MRSFSSKSTLFFFVISTIFFSLCLSAWAAEKPKEAEKSEQKAASDESIVVGRIAYYEITKGELEQRMMMELRPYDRDYYGEEEKPVDVNDVLLEMIAEKAMIIEARSKDVLKDEMIQTSIKRFADRRLVNLLAQKRVDEKASQITSSEEEIKQKMQTNSKLKKEQAEQLVKREKANNILNEYFKEIYEKSNVKKFTENYRKVAEFHDRLLNNPKEPRKQSWILNTQIKNDLTPEEQQIVLAEHKNGKITIKDWFQALCDIVPPRRPKRIDPQIVDQMLEGALRMPLLVAEAESLGLDKDKEYLKQVRDYEDRRLLSEAIVSRQKEVKEPTPEQIKTYFNAHKEEFGISKTVKVDTIWCDDLATAAKAKAELSGGKDFEAVKQQYSLNKTSKPFNTNPGSEGLFWKEIWAGDPNQVIGPIKGFYGQGVKWRIVKIFEKKPAELREFSDNLANQVKSRMMSQQREDLLESYHKEMLKKYPHMIYDERLKGIDPLAIP